MKIKTETLYKELPSLDKDRFEKTLTHRKYELDLDGETYSVKTYSVEITDDEWNKIIDWYNEKVKTNTLIDVFDKSIYKNGKDWGKIVRGGNGWFVSENFNYDKNWWGGVCECFYKNTFGRLPNYTEVCNG